MPCAAESQFKGITVRQPYVRSISISNWTLLCPPLSSHYQVYSFSVTDRTSSIITRSMKMDNNQQDTGVKPKGNLSIHITRHFTPRRRRALIYKHTQHLRKTGDTVYLLRVKMYVAHTLFVYICNTHAGMCNSRAPLTMCTCVYIGPALLASTWFIICSIGRLTTDFSSLRSFITSTIIADRHRKPVKTHNYALL